MLELQKLKQRVDEFNDYGELDMMQQYVQDVRQVQKRLQQSQEEIDVSKTAIFYVTAQLFALEFGSELKIRRFLCPIIPTASEYYVISLQIAEL